MDHKIVVLFDFDGVIANTVPALKQAYWSFLESFQKQPSNEEFAKLDGPSLAEVIKILKKRYHLPGLFNVLYHKYMKHVNQELEKVKPFPDVKEVFQFLQNQHVPICICSAASSSYIHRFLTQWNLNSYIRLVCTPQDKKGKPDPHVYQLAAKNYPHHRFLVIEDSLQGLRAANKFGVLPVWFSQANSTAPVPLVYHATSHKDLLYFLKKVFTNISLVFFQKLIKPPLRIKKLDEILVHEDTKLQEKVEETWNNARKKKPFLFDGKVACYGGLQESKQGTILSIYPTSYKLIYSCLTNPELLDAFSHIPNGVSGIVSVFENNQIWVLIGKRTNVAKYDDMWECAPSGALDVGKKVDPKQHILQELEEETCIKKNTVDKIEILGLWLDTYVKTYDLCYCIQLRKRQQVPKRTEEYSSIKWIPIHKVWQYDMIPLAGSILCYIATHCSGYKKLIPQRRMPRLL